MIIILLTLLFVFFPSPAFSLDECPFRIEPVIRFDGRFRPTVVLKPCRDLGTQIEKSNRTLDGFHCGWSSVRCGYYEREHRARRRGCAILGFHSHRTLAPAYSRRVFRDGSAAPFRVRVYGFTYECDLRSQLRFGVLYYFVF